MRKILFMLCLIPALAHGIDSKKAQIIVTPDGRKQYYPKISSVSIGDLLDGPKILDEGILQGSATSFNFVGAGVTASVGGGTATITINGGGAGGGSDNLGSHVATTTIKAPFGIDASSGVVQSTFNVYGLIQSTAGALLNGATIFDLRVPNLIVSSMTISSNTYTVNISSVDGKIVLTKVGTVTDLNIQFMGSGGTGRSGFYYAGSDNFNAAANATQIMNFNSATVGFLVPFSWNPGTVTSPGMRNSSALNDGFYAEGGPVVALGASMNKELQKWWSTFQVSIGAWGGSNSNGGGGNSVPGAGFFVSTAISNVPLVCFASGTTASPVLIACWSGSSTAFHNTFYNSSPTVFMDSVTFQPTPGALGGFTVTYDSVALVQITSGSWIVGNSTGGLGRVQFANPPEGTFPSVLFGTKTLASPSTSGTIIGVAYPASFGGEMMNFTVGTVKTWSVNGNGVITTVNGVSTNIGNSGHTVSNANGTVTFGNSSSAQGSFANVTIQAGQSPSRTDSAIIFTEAGNTLEKITSSGTCLGYNCSGARANFDLTASTSLSRPLLMIQSTVPLNGIAPSLTVYADTTTHSMSVVDSSGGIIIGGATSYFNAALTVMPLKDFSGNNTTISTYTAVLGSATVAGVYSMAITTTNHISFAGNTPFVAAGDCGSTPEGTVDGNDTDGVITVGGGIGTTCKITFGIPLNFAPIPVVSDSNAAIGVSINAVSNTSLTVGLSAALASGKIYYHIFGKRE